MRLQKIKDTLTFLHRSKKLEAEERYKISLSRHKNSVAEHSWRLGLMAIVISTECKIPVNMERVLTLATLHDLAEAETGDIDAYAQALGGKILIANKANAEISAMHKMTDDLIFGGWIYDLWEEYENQITLEAKFVRALDKIEGFLHIAEVGVEAYIPKEFHSTYADAAVIAFDEATQHFPELKDLLNAVKANLKKQFAIAGIEWVE